MNRRQIVVERTMNSSATQSSLSGTRWKRAHRQVAASHEPTRPSWARNISRSNMRAAGTRTKVAAALAVAMALSGCGNIEPWVKPYERQALADPIMAFDANPISSAYRHHVFEAREGARGALGSGGGGCGCN
jgi:hypothetical protein